MLELLIINASVVYLGYGLIAAAAGVIAALILLGLNYYGRLVPAWRLAYGAFLVVIVLATVWRIIAAMRANVLQLPEWDFLGFWLYSRAALAGLDVYAPGAVGGLAAAFHPTATFSREIIDTGFWYPPPTLLLFAPLGVMELRPAYAMWYGFNAFVIAADIVLSWWIFMPRDRTNLAATAALFLLLPGTLLTINAGQTNFLALGALLLFWVFRDSVAGGAWMAVATIVKPFLAILFVFSLLRRRIAVAAAGVAVLAALSLAAGAWFGWSNVASYFHPGRYAMLPAWVYTETTNQSLLATILRFRHGEQLASPPHDAVYTMLALLLFALTCVLMLRLNGSNGEWSLALSILLSLIVYPTSQMFYSIMLIAPLLLLWKHRSEVPYGTAIVAVVTCLAYALMRSEVFWATLLLWCLVAAVALAVAVRGEASPVRVRAVSAGGLAGG